jgi:uncharacterized protein YndB with AHSA1/START domain
MAPMDGGCALRLTRRYSAPPAEVWLALTDPESVARWLGRPLGPVLREEPPHLLELDWSSAGEPRSRVRFELSDADGGTVLTLDHRGIAAPRGMASAGWWTNALARFPVELR